MLLDADLKRACWPLRGVAWRSVVFPSALIGGASSPVGDVDVDAAGRPHSSGSPRACAVGRWPPSAVVLRAVCRRERRVSADEQGRPLREGRDIDVPETQRRPERLTRAGEAALEWGRQSHTNPRKCFVR